MKAVGAASDSAHAIVDPLDGSVRQAEVDVGKDPVAILSDRACHADEGAESRTARPAEPFLQSLLGAAGLLVAEQVSESLLEEIGSVERAIRSLNVADLGPVLDGQVPLAAEQGEARSLDR